MPHFLAPKITKTQPGLWAEGNPYSSAVIYDICTGDEAAPPIHYEGHTLKPHSICHFDAPGHIIPDGESIDILYDRNPEMFYGPALVVVLPKPDFRPHPKMANVKHAEVSRADLEKAISRIDTQGGVKKLILSFEGITGDFYADPTRAFTLSVQAAHWLTTLPDFNLLGTPWKSVDFQPASRDRPVHKFLLPRIGVLECLNVTGIEAGEYFLSACPLPLVGATESPVAPILFTWEEIRR